MFRALVRRWKLIHYYSARKPQSRWSHALTAALFASLLLGPLTVPAIEAVSTRTRLVREVEGGIVKMDEDSYLAVVVRDEEQRVPWTSGTPFGEFRLRKRALTQGFPFATRSALIAPTLDLRLFSEGVERRDVAAEGIPGLRVAIEQALEEWKEDEMLAAWQRRAEQRSQRRWWSTVGSAAMWWIIWSFASWLVISLAQLATLIARDRRRQRVEQRSSAGLCATCGYNLRGLEFHARCPECGALIE